MHECFDFLNAYYPVITKMTEDQIKEIVDKSTANYKERTNWGGGFGIGSCVIGLGALFTGPIGWTFGLAVGLGVVG